LEYPRKEGTGVPVWALTAYGRSLVLPLVPWLPPPAASDIGARFLEHTLWLNDVLAGLVVALRISVSAPLAALPFRWLSEGDQVLEFHPFEQRLGERVKAVLKSDAILELPGRGRRLFVEAETGSQSIVTAHPDRTGAIVSKLSRYSQFFSCDVPGQDETWYESAFPDGFEPRLLFLVHSEERRDRVAAAVKKTLGSRGPDRFQVLVYTCAEATSVLAPYITRGQLRPPASRGATRIVTMDARKADQLREGYNELAKALDAARDVVKRHNATPGATQLPVVSVRMENIRALRDFIQREVDGGASHAPGGPAGNGAAS
jgi:hypothetical protein